MKKRLFAIIIAVLVLFSNAIPVFAVGDMPNVVDNASLLDEYEYNLLESNLERKSENMQFDIVIVTVDSLDGKTAMEYADDFYDYNGYGYTERKDGCLLLISMEDRDWWISTTGFGIDALSDASIDYIGDIILDDLSNGDYYDAFSTYAETVVNFVIAAVDGETYDINNLSNYDSEYGKKKNDFDIEHLFTSVVIGLIIGAIFTAVIISILVGAMKSVRHKATANDYLLSESLVLTEANDIYVTSHVTKTERQTESRGGSSTHVGSSGTSHGGGGGKF